MNKVVLIYFSALVGFLCKIVKNLYLCLNFNPSENGGHFIHPPPVTQN